MGAGTTARTANSKTDMSFVRRLSYMTKRIIRRITPKHCCATCKHATFEGMFDCELDPENELTSWDSGDTDMGYTVTCNHWLKILQPQVYR